MDKFLTVQVVQSNCYLVHATLCHSLRKTNLRERTDRIKEIMLD